jgi:TonB family protein
MGSVIMRSVIMKLIVLLFCCALALGQDTSHAPETKSQNPTNSSEQQAAAAQTGVTHPRNFGALDVLSNTYGIDFGPYLTGVVRNVRENWLHLIPASDQMKNGRLAIEYKIMKDGKVADMKIVAPSGEMSLDRSAWGSITASNPFPPLPEAFPDAYLHLRSRFYYNPQKSDLESKMSGIKISILAASDLQVPVGGSEEITATVTGTKDLKVDWSVTGSGCSGSACGKMIGLVYFAPSVLPNPPDVTLTAVSRADPTAKTSVIVHLVEPASKTASKP